MDNLKSIMQSLDEISSMIPEGTYLEMADNLKRVHENLPKNEDPPIIDRRSIPVNVPFQVVQPGMAVYRLPQYEEDESTDEEYEPSAGSGIERLLSGIEIDSREYRQNESIIKRLMDDIKIADRSLRALKPIGNITKKIRENAIREYCDGDRECVGGGDWTFDNLNAATTWSSENERKECTSKRYERTLYNNYRMRQNNRISRLTHDARELKRDLEDDVMEYRDRQSYLSYNMMHGQ